jgi:pimeloyl-ACP methyl ester carboxylesterase
MNKPSKPGAPDASDLRGAARLATDATLGLTDLVEAMHERIARLPFTAQRGAAGRTRGITGLVYQTIRGITRGVGGGVDGLLALLTPALKAQSGHPQREAIVAAINGVLGDHLVASANPLAIPMTWRHQGQPLQLQAPVIPGASGRVLVLMHGLCMNHLQWCRDGHDHGAMLAREAGYTPIYLHYNSGQHISTNGHTMALQLETLLQNWPLPLTRVVLLGHSMGGLLARSAFAQAEQAGLAWPKRVHDMVFLGTPHHGAPLERAGHWVDLLLGAAPYAAPLARLGQVRSAGITDLRHGFLLEQDWAGRDRFAQQRRHLPTPVPLPQQLRCYAVATSLGAREGDVKDRLLGDGLVPLASALGEHRNPARALHFEAGRTWVGYGINHLELLSSQDVSAQLLAWLR